MDQKNVWVATVICGATAGDVYFAKNGLVGASKQWGSPVFGSVAFINRFIPPGWPSGVLWNKKYKHLRYWKYSDNPLRPNKEFWQSIPQGRALIRVFHIPKAKHQLLTKGF